jgi:ABC-type branched-subunit amino acid transport system ATPase component
MPAILEFAELVRTFGGVRAVDGATFEVESGSITGLIGPNGAGKTTVFNCATGTLRPDSGRILFEGGRLDRKPPYRIAREGLVRTFQTARPLTRLSVRENVMLAGKDQPGERLTGWLWRPKAARRQEELVRRRADELLALVRLDSHADAYAGTLSGGQRKLLDLARALMVEPKLVLLDEPMAGVSPPLRLELLNHIIALRAQGVTFLIVEHDLDFVMQVADVVVVMNEGRVIARGSPDAVRRDDRVVDAYLGKRHEAVAS